MASPYPNSPQSFAAAADLLDQGQLVNRLSTALTAIAFAALLLPVFPGAEALAPLAVLAALVGLVQIALAMRAGLKAAQYRRLAHDAANPPSLQAASPAPAPAPAGKAARPPVRPAAPQPGGARWLLLAQCLTLLVQVALAIAAGAYTVLQSR